MNVDFPIDKIHFNFTSKGNGKIQIIFNGELLEHHTIQDKIKKHNTIEIRYFKSSPADKESYAEITAFQINDFNFLDEFKTIEYYVDKIAHRDVGTDSIPNNLYFGYIGHMKFTLTQDFTKLQESAWRIANNNFTTVKWPTRNNPYREYNLKNVKDDARYMFTGCTPPANKSILNYINNLKLNECQLPLDLPEDRKRIQKWVNKSDRIEIQNFDYMKHFTVSNGISESLDNLLNSDKTIYMPKKIFHYHNEILADKTVNVVDIFAHDPPNGSTVLFELPSPWYTNDELLERINVAKKNNCKVALDLTWLPVSTNSIKIDLTGIDQIFVSMNKTWPIQMLRPAFRWSRVRINDTQTFNTECCMYTKAPPSVFMKLIEQFNFDYTYKYYQKDFQKICKIFKLSHTSVLWFTKNSQVGHDYAQPIYENFFLDDFVSVTKLLEDKNKFSWQ